MSIGRLITLGAIVGGGFWAYRAGYMAPILDKLGLSGGDGESEATGKGGGVFGDMFGPFLPVAGDGSAASNRWEKVLRDNWGHVQPWARSNVSWVAAMIKQESGNQGSDARGSAGEIGLMQVKPDTAVWMKNLGYGQMQPTAAVLGTDAGGIYWGTAFLQYLSGIKSNRAWITKAYNGGPGWEGLSDSYKAARETYYREVLAKHGQLYGASV